MTFRNKFQAERLFKRGCLLDSEELMDDPSVSVFMQICYCCIRISEKPRTLFDTT